MSKYFTFFFLFVFTLSAFAVNNKMYENNKIYPASPEFLQMLKADLTSDLDQANVKIPNRDAILSDNPDTLTLYYERMTQPRLYGITVNNQTYPMVGTNPIFYFVGQKFYLGDEQLGKYRIGGVLIPYAINYTAGIYQDTSNIWTYSIDQDGNINSGTPVALGKLLHSDIQDTSSSEVLFSYFPVDSSGIINSGFVMFVQTQNFSAQETDFVAIWANNQGDGMSEKRSAFLAWDNNNQHFVTGNFGDLQIQMPDGNPPDFDVLILPVMVPALPDAVDEPITINGLTYGGLYPNPIRNVARLDFALNQSTNLTISLVSVNGTLVKELANSSYGTGEHSLEFNTEGLSSGNYMIVFRSNLSNFAVKTIIVK